MSPTKFNKTKKIKKNISLLAVGKDKKETDFVEIIKHKEYPFYGFQAHPERNNPKLLTPYLNNVKSAFLERITNLSKNDNAKHKKTYRIKSRVRNKLRNKLKNQIKKIRFKTIKCKKYGLSVNSKDKCRFYKITKK